ncbi:PREDICTED: uncharacterized protein LOC106930114 [Poecilia mexicana]|uniref:uncharacterized protein LOC106930114 n=1 Tax=Poecilia mexicana TaxID=48701 RepID=UPI00072E5B66|nr:PREDICTED: uncharacterized protein LOC106930114 [Poecilia mexicana]
MWKFTSLPLAVFLLTVVGGDQEDFQSYLPEQTKGTAVTNSRLLEKTITIVRGTEAAPSQTTHRGIEEEPTAEFPKASVFDTKLKPTNEGMPTASLATTLQSTGNILSSNVQSSLKSSTAFHSESKVPLKSDYAKIVSSSTPTALVLNDTFEPRVHLSAKAVKAPPWFSVPLATGSRRNANSVIPTSADTGLLLPIPSASPPRVIDNLTELFNNSDDLRPQEKSIRKLGENEDLPSKMQFILQADPAIDSMKGNDVTDLCLTCLKDGKAMSSEKFAASSTASLNSSHSFSTGKSKEAKESNIFKNAINYNHTSLPFTHNKTERKTVSFSSHIAAELSSEKHKFTTLPPSRTHPSNIFVTASPKLTSISQYPSSKPSYTGQKPVKHGHKETFNENVSIREPQSNPVPFTQSEEKASHSLSTSLRNQDISTGPVSNAPFFAPLSSFNSPLPKGRAHGTASHPTRMNSIEALAAVTPFTLRRPTVSTVKNLKSGFLTGKAGTFISVSNSQTKPKPTSRAEQSILTLLPKDLTVRLASVTHKQSPANLQTTASTTAVTRVQTSTFSTRKVRLKVFDFDVSQSALTEPKSMSFNKKQIETQSKITEGRDFEGNRPDSKLIDLHNIHSLTLGDERESILSVVTENKDKDTLQSNSSHGREITKMFLEEDTILENKREELLRLDDPEIEKRAAEIKQSTYREAGEMKEFISKTSREEHVLPRHDKNTQDGEVKDERDAKREGVTKINTQNSTLDAAGKQKQFLEENGAKAESGEDRKFNKDIGKEDVTNVPPEPATNWKELNGDKERIVEKLSPCPGLIKESDSSELKGIHLGENASQIRDLTNKSFSFEVTSNRQLPHPSVRSPDPREEELPKEDIMLPPKETSSQEFEVTLPATAASKMSGSISVFTPLISPSGRAANAAKLPSLTTRFQRAESHFTVSGSLNASIIQSNTDHKHKLNYPVQRTEAVSHTAIEQEHAEYATPSIHQQMYDDSSAKTPTVTVLSFKPHISVGPFQPHRGQSAPQRSHSSSSCPNITPGQTSLSRVSEQASHPDTLHTPAAENKQRLPQARTTSSSTTIPAAGINGLSPESVSPMMKPRTLSGDRLTVTYGLQKLTGSQQAHFVPGSNSKESSLAAAGETEAVSPAATSQRKKKGDVMLMMTSVVRHSDGVAGDQRTTVGSKHVANDTDEFNSTSLQTKNETKQSDLSTAGGKDEANNIIMTAKHHQHFETAVPYTAMATNRKFGHDTNDADTIDRVGTAMIFQTGNLPERPKIQSDEEPNSLSDIEHRLAKTNVRHNSQPLSQQSEGNNSDQITNMNSSTDRAIHKITFQTFDQARHIVSQFQTNANKTADFVSLTETPAEFRGFTSLLVTSGTLPDSRKLTQNAAEHRSQPYARPNPLTQRELPITHTSDKLTPAVSRIKTMEAHSVQEQPEEEILARAAEQGQHALLSTTALSHNINMAESGFSESYVQTPAASEQMSYLSLKGIKSVPLPVNIYGEHSQDRVEKQKNHTLPKRTSISQAFLGHVTDFVPLAEIPPTEFVNTTSCSSSGCTKSGETTEAVVIDPTKEMFETRFPEKNNFLAQNANKTKSGSNWSFHRSLPEKSAPQAVELKVLHFSVTSKWEQDYTSDDTASTKAKSTSDETVHLERKDAPQWTRFVTTTTQRRFQNTFGVVATEGTLSESGAAAVETTIKSTEKTLPVEGNTKTQLDRRVGRARMLAEQNVSRSPRAHAKDETASPESGSRLLVSEPQTKSELPRLNQRRRTSPHQYVSGVTEISDDICGSGNYTAEMRLKMGRSVEPGDVVPARGNLRAIINLKTNNSQINLGVTACCLSPTRQPDFNDSTRCLFFRPGAEPPGITLLPSALSTSASFTISLFQMINYSVVYLHCDLSVCLRNHSDCERQCASEGADTVAANLRNRISFGPVLKQAKNSTFPTEIDPSQLDLVLVFVSLVVGVSLVSLLLLLVWLAYHRRAIWLLRSAAPSPACCGCLRPGGDLISP